MVDVEERLETGAHGSYLPYQKFPAELTNHLFIHLVEGGEGRGFIYGGSLQVLLLLLLLLYGAPARALRGTRTRQGWLQVLSLPCSSLNSLQRHCREEDLRASAAHGGHVSPGWDLHGSTWMMVLREVF